MKTLMFVLLILISFTVYAGNGNRTLGMGEKAAFVDVKMLDISGQKISLNDALKKNGVVVLFSANTCPFVLRWEERYPDLKAWADKHEVGMIVLNSNHQKRNGDDSYEAMKQHAKEKGYNFYYALDENSLLANSFGGQTTPHAFLFNRNFEMEYKGAIDDSYESADKVQQSYLKNAIASVAAGTKVAVAETKPVGCGIKRKIE